ncbi:ABC transporter permease [Glutamicibacter sp. MNS18]|uniref:ABC transporter permease n=1 Tax=Glutamicibacter sp. MNS18 TaxID=2989817 RepID=UPI002235BDB5|nr:ABC transporter permease [Glutamicibacter sp. MNS18]MCW4467210.1 ABC transporter permease [Glutamicibacter sp. MNS18]
MGAVIALIAVLTVILSGLSSGLVNDGVSGLKSMPVSAFAFDEGTKTDNAFSRSVVEQEQVASWSEQPGIEQATAMGSSMMNATTDDGTQVDVAVFGVDPSSFLSPAVSDGRQLGAVDGLVVSETMREAGVEIGTVLTMDRIDTELTVIGFTEGQATFGHVDIAYAPLSTWQLIAAGQAPAGAPTQQDINGLDFNYSSVVALQYADGAEVDLAAGDAAANTTSKSLSESFNSSPGYEAETLTLSMIQVFLYAICGLVVGAFFSVWTIQRKQEIAVLRAIGAPVRYLLRDGVTQAALLLMIFTALGIGAGLGLGAAMPAGMPFALEGGPIAIAAALTITLGLVGAVISIIRIARIDPLTALGGNR